MQKIISRIFSNERQNFLDNHYLDPEQYKAYNYISACGTDTFGFNTLRCEDCGHKLIHYNSCGNRNCPSCQYRAREEWISRMRSMLIQDLVYFHIVFTVPDSLNEIFLNNKTEMYNILFDASSKTMLAACQRDYGQIGFTSILHTWGQNLWFHPHIHMMVSGGGLYKDKNDSYSFRKSSNTFLVSVRVLSKLFRGKFMDRLLKSKVTDSSGKTIDFRDEPYKSLVSELYSKDWVVYAKKPFGSNEAVLNYIGRYSHRVAISNSRILSYDEVNHKVSFKFKDYRDENKIKVMTLDADEFIRRFIQHVLPSRFLKIRHYGFMSNSNRQKKIPLCRKLLNVPVPEEHPEFKAIDWVNRERRCPKCNGLMLLWDCHEVEKPDFSLLDRVT